MMRAKIECMQNHNHLEIGMNNSNMRDFVTAKERLTNPAYLDKFDVFIIIICMIVIGSIQTWL
jgi:hypothetical protein